jgi:hypothetical protein
VKASVVAVILIGITVMFGNGCSSSKDSSVGANNPGTPPVSQSLDPWNAEVGDLVPGVTLSEGWEDLRFLPGPVNVDGGWTDSAHIAASGTSLYFTYSRNDFFKFYASGGGVKDVTGPVRAGMVGNEFKIFRADLGLDGKWTVNFHPVNSPDINVVESSQSLNQAEDNMVFTRWTSNPPSYDGDIYFSSKDSNGNWTTPVSAPFNSGCVDDNAFIVGNQSTSLSIYFESFRADDAGTSCGPKKRLFYTKLSQGVFSPVRLVAGLNANVSLGEEDEQPFVSLDEQHLYWTRHRVGSYGIYMADRVGEASYTNMRPVALPVQVPPIAGKVVFIGEANIANVKQGSLLYMMCGLALNEHNGNIFLDADNIRLKVCRARRPNP